MVLNRNIVVSAKERRNILAIALILVDSKKEKAIAFLEKKSRQLNCRQAWKTKNRKFDP
jgi:hypothetical protein